MIANCPFFAANVPPDTGASKKYPPFLLTFFSISIAVSCLVELISISMCPFFIFLVISLEISKQTLSLASIIIIT